MRKNITLAGIAISALMYSQNAPQDYTTNTNNAGKHIPKISPTSPESFKFSQYGNVPIGMFTGAPNINIPITELSVDGTSIPISLNYSSNGINIDEMNGSVGLGWTFISGGVITRTIRDRADEDSSFGSGDVPLIDNSPQLTEYLKLCENDDFDSEPDLYTANFGGYNVKFLISKTDKIVMIDQKDYQILRNDNGNLFSIILDNGVRYNFNATENIQNRTLNTGSHQPPQQYIQSWYLTSIVTTSGQILTLEYQDVNYTTILSQSQTMAYTKTVQQKYSELQYDDLNDLYYCTLKPYTIPPDLGLIADLEQYAAGKQLKKIYDSNNNSIVFSYSAQNGDYSKLTNIKKYHQNIAVDDYSFNYTTTGASRLFLNEIRDNKTNSSHKFTYYSPEILPSRLSFSRDMWGYYNGAINTNLVPQLFVSTDPIAPQYNGANQGVSQTKGYYGLLKMITYPTGGNTLFNYESHKRKEYVLIPAVKTNVQINTFTPQNDFSTSKEVIITPNKTGPVEINLSNYLYPYGNCQGSSDLETEKQEAHLEVRDQTGNLIANLDSSLNNSSQIIVNGVKNQPLKFTLTAMFFCCNAYAQIYYYDQDDKYELQDVLKGGYRISSTVDTPSDGLPVTKKYHYIQDNGEYSINVTRDPVFIEDKWTASLCMGSKNGIPVFSNYTAITSSNIARLFSFNPNIFYSTVQEEIEGKGKTIHHYSSYKDNPGSALRGNFMESAPWTNLGWNNGKELLTVYKDNAGTTLKTVETKYAEDPTRTYYLGGISRRKIYEPIIHDSTWFDFQNLDAVYYKNISRFTYLESQKTTDYFNGTPVETKTEYFYNNPSHYQIKKKKNTLPDGSINETEYSYAHEKNNQLMIDKNMVGIPLETNIQQTMGNTTKMLSRAQTVYPTSLPQSASGNLVLPLSQYSFDNQNPSISYKEVSYDKYDEKGNILQYTTNDGTPVSIVWGYNKTKPIAKIVGSSYSQLENLIANIVAKSDEDSADPAKEAELLLAFESFKPTGMVTSYTYDPLVGVTSITSPSGIREIYVYDNAGQLKEIKTREKDNTGNYVIKVVKEFKYNYKQ
ncbi:hypothetical protein [Chryseobacterium indologenes]|uniref:hypothetical protein n=1 Tax=Chryseobacterium indologenes TaxID=253 RepID=UPI000B5195B6|nr:hypothetical protein [Chryseobacterium indologenes]ASE62170.1 hypothetical protein CEQ15_12040 [Chryseobacterium indologenes]VFA41655.1 Uncharacterised protein [Chryseobacterium indologenes]